MNTYLNTTIYRCTYRLNMTYYIQYIYKQIHQTNLSVNRQLYQSKDPYNCINTNTHLYISAHVNAVRYRNRMRSIQKCKNRHIIPIQIALYLFKEPYVYNYIQRNRYLENCIHMEIELNTDITTSVQS